MVDPMDNPMDGDELELPEAMKAQLRGFYGPTNGKPDATQWSRMDAAMASHLQSHFGGVAADTSSPMASPRAVGAPGRSLGITVQDSTPTAERTSPSVLGRWVIWRAAAALATAAAIGIIVWINTNGDVAHERSPGMVSRDTSTVPPQPGDINRDGRVDILDAYLLQRRIETAAKIEAQWDLTRDGQVDRHDVEAIAAQSVKLDGGPRL